MAFEEITIEQLRLGMYVKLECSWWRHPFATNKFKVTNRKDLQTIRKISKLKLYYDPDLSDPEAAFEEGEESVETDAAPPTPQETDTTTGESHSDADRQQEREPHESPASSLIHLGGCQAQRASAFLNRREQLKQTERLHQEALKQTKLAFKQMSNGNAAGIEAAERALTNVGDILNKDKTTIALVELMNCADPEDPLIFHSVNVSVLSMLVGKELELNGDDLFALGLGALAHDIGMLNMPQNLRLTTAGFAHSGANLELHIEHGKRVADRIPDFPPESVTIIQQHHERLNGQGYPLGLKDPDLSPLAKIVMIVDEYDDLCNNPDRPQTLTPYETLSLLYQNETVKRRGEFSQEILVALIRLLGVYPPGTIVELNNGAIGQVVNINPEKRTHPQILLYAPEIRKDEAVIVDLTQDEELAITRSLRPREASAHIRAFLNPHRMTGYFPSSSDVLAAAREQSQFAGTR